MVTKIKQKNKSSEQKRGPGRPPNPTKATKAVKNASKSAIKKSTPAKNQSAQKTEGLDIEVLKDLAISQMRAYLPELGLQKDLKSKNPDTHYKNEKTGIRVALRGHHADGSVASPVVSYYLAITGPNMKIKKYPQLRTGKFSWENINTKVSELQKTVFQTAWQTIAARLEDKKPKNPTIKMLPASSDKKVRVRFQFDKEMNESSATSLFEALNGVA